MRNALSCARTERPASVSVPVVTTSGAWPPAWIFQEAVPDHFAGDAAASPRNARSLESMLCGRPAISRSIVGPPPTSRFGNFTVPVTALWRGPTSSEPCVTSRTPAPPFDSSAASSVSGEGSGMFAAAAEAFQKRLSAFAETRMEDGVSRVPWNATLPLSPLSSMPLPSASRVRTFRSWKWIRGTRTSI